MGKELRFSRENAPALPLAGPDKRDVRGAATKRSGGGANSDQRLGPTPLSFIDRLNFRCHIVSRYGKNFAEVLKPSKNFLKLIFVMPANSLKLILLERQIKQSDLARKVGTTEPKMSAFINHGKGLPMEVIEKISKELDHPVEDILKPPPNDFRYPRARDMRLMEEGSQYSAFGNETLESIYGTVLKELGETAPSKGWKLCEQLAEISRELSRREERKP